MYGRGKKKLWCLSDDHHVTMWELDEALDEEGLGNDGLFCLLYTSLCTAVVST